jgi:quercetin dioxygenase-like cupin family protein
LIGAASSVAQAPPAGRGAPPTIFSAPLAEFPGHNLVVVELSYAPNPAPPSTAEDHGAGHRHPGSVYVHVTQGAVRLGIEGQPVQVVQTGGSFFEPPGALHTINENASATEPARAIAVMIVPEGKPLTTRDAQ